MSTNFHVPANTPVGREIETIFAAQEDEEGDLDVDGVLAALDRLLEIVEPKDLPELMGALGSPRNNFWTRELLAEPIANVGGPDCFPEMFDALHRSTLEGHDNDHFHAVLIGMAERNPDATKAKLESIRATSEPQISEIADWLIQFCE